MDKMADLDPGLLKLVRDHAGAPIEEAKTYNHAIDSLKIRVITEKSPELS